MINDYKILRQVENNLLKNKYKEYKRDDYIKIKWENKVI
jgi:hypothetical protein